MTPSMKETMVKMELRMGTQHFIGYGVVETEYNETATVQEYKRRLAVAQEAAKIVSDVVTGPFEQECAVLFDKAVTELKGA